jgi:hypothetical protein
VSAGTTGGDNFGFVDVSGVCSATPFAFEVKTRDQFGTLSNNIGFTAVVP